MTTPEELQAEVEALRDKLARSQQGREADLRTAEANLDFQLGKQAKALEDRFVAETQRLHATHLAQLQTQQREHEADKEAFAQQMSKDCQAALQRLSDDAAAARSALETHVAALKADLAKYQAAAGSRAEALFAARKILTDADAVLSAAVREA